MFTTAEEYFNHPRYFSGHGQNGNYPMVCRAAIERGDGRVVGCGNQICYGFMGQYREAHEDKIGMKGFYGSLWVKNPEMYQAACDYWDFLFDEAISPYRPLLPGHRIIRDKQGRPRAFYLAVNENTSSQYFINLCIATRMPFEHEPGLKAYDFFVKRGFSKHESILFTATLRLFSGDKRTYFQEAKDGQHVFMDNNYLIPLERIVKAAPALQNLKLASGHSYMPCNDIWNDHSQSSKVVAALCASERYKGAFPKKFKLVMGVDYFADGLETNPEKVVEKLMAIRGSL